MPFDPNSTGSVSAKDLATYLQGAAGNPTDLAIAGLAGATTPSRYVGATAAGCPITGTFLAGDFVLSLDGNIYVCTVAGSPGTWTRAGDDPYMAGLGLKAWNFNPNGITGNSALTSQLIYGVLLATQAGRIYTGIKVWIAAAGTSTAPTGFFVGLASNAVIGSPGTILAQSDNLKDSAALTATGIATLPFSAPYTEVATGLRQAVFLQNGAFAGVNVTFYKSTASILAATATQIQADTAGSGQTALPATGSPLGNYSGSSALPIWAALY